MSDPTADDRERALFHVVEMQRQLKQIALVLRRTSGFFDDPRDKRYKRELHNGDWAELAVRADALADEVKRLQGKAHALAK